MNKQPQRAQLPAADIHRADELQNHAAALLYLSFDCKDRETAEQLRKIGQALVALAEVGSGR